MALRKYNAPNVEYNEIDRSQYGSRTAAVGTMSFVTGFADKGDDYDIKYSETLEDFIASYGYPTNEAERYFFNTAYEAFKQGGRLASAKIPYDNKSKDKFAFTAYQVDEHLTEMAPSLSPPPSDEIDINVELYEAFSNVDSSVSSYIRIASVDKEQLSDAVSCIGTFQDGLMSMQQYDSLLVNSARLDQNLILIVDIDRNKYSKDPNIDDADVFTTNRYLGYVPVVVDPIHALKFQNVIDLTSSHFVDKFGLQTIPNVDMMSVQLTTGAIDYLPINNIPNISSLLSNSFEIQLASDTIFDESVEKLAANQFPTIRFDSSKRLDRKYLKQIGIVVFKMYVDVSNNKKVNFTPVEAFIGSLNKKDKDILTNKSIFIDDVVNQNSQLINVFSNVNFANYGPTGGVENDHSKAATYFIEDQKATTLGFFDSQCTKLIDFEDINSSLDRILERAKDPNSVPIDIVVDGGVSNIAQWVYSNGNMFYEPEYDTISSYNIANGEPEKWRWIIQKFDNFTKNVRKDCIFLADGVRSLCLLGNEKVIRKTAPENTIAKTMIPQVRKMIAIDSSYSAGYCNWFKCYDYASRDYFWCPPSIKAMGVYLYTDRYANTWDAPAGDNRGRITDAVDIAFNPIVEEAQYFYMQQWNYAMAFPMTGIVLEGQKTFQTEQTALDRVNVRRLCNAIKKGVKEIARHYLYEGITDQVMTNFRDRIDDFLGRIKNLNGISEYYIKLDHENNTVETIERNELHVAFAIRPIKTLEWILIDAVVANQSADLEEVVQSILQ